MKPSTLEGVLYVLDKVYGGERSYVDLNNKLCNVAQSYNESVKDYFELVIAIRSKLIKHHSHHVPRGPTEAASEGVFLRWATPRIQGYDLPPEG